MTVNDLPDIIQLLGFGFAIGAGGAVGAYIIGTVVNTFIGIANS